MCWGRFTRRAVAWESTSEASEKATTNLRKLDHRTIPNANYRQGTTLIEGNRQRLPINASQPSVSYAEFVELYPLQRPLFGVGLVAGLVALILQDWIVALCIFTLFAMIGASWRMDMVPIIPVARPSFGSRRRSDTSTI